MTETMVYLVSSFWLGGVHAVTPGHGKTIAAAYIVGLRGRPVDALVLGVFVTLSHTFGIVLVAVLASIGSSWAVPQRIEAYLAFGTGALVIGIGLWMFWGQWRLLRQARASDDGLRQAEPAMAAPLNGHGAGPGHHHAHDHAYEHAYAQAHGHEQDHTHVREHAPVSSEWPVGHLKPVHAQLAAEPVYHQHGWGPSHAHTIEVAADKRPSLWILLWLAIAGGLLPDPAALAILLAAIANGRLVLGLCTVAVFSLGFASVLVIVGIVAARVGEVIFTWLSSRRILYAQIGVSVVILLIGVVLTMKAWQTLW
jgi:nickel/cobalt transporter (NicO) family protein